MNTVAQLGSGHAKYLVTEYLSSDLPNRLINFRNAWSLDDISLPDPALYLTYEPIALDVWPTIITVVISTRDITRMGYVGGANPEYQVSYSMRTYIWVRTEGSQACTDMRDRLTTVLRSSLLDGACMKTEDFVHSSPARIEEGTISEEFSDLTLLKGDRVLAGAYIGYDITMMESELRTSTLPDVSSITMDPIVNVNG